MFFGLIEFMILFLDGLLLGYLLFVLLYVLFLGVCIYYIISGNNWLYCVFDFIKDELVM